MNRLNLCLLMVVLAGCSSNPNPSAIDSTKAKSDTAVTMRMIQSPYPIMYSSNFVTDDPKNAESLLAFWKAFDNGDLSSVKDFFADTVEVHLASGMAMRTSRDSTLAAVQAFRNGLKAVSSDVSAVMAVKSVDKNGHWALIWGMEKDTYKNGKMDSTELQETWRFDDNGKANLFFQYAAKPPKR